MKNTIFLPKVVKVGFQNRSDTYTKQLAYVIYYDQSGKLRKEPSWSSWRDNKIEPVEFENEPTSGFVLNKKAGGYSTGWNHRQTYVRVFDPRNFEFEITIPNLLYILENTSSIKGKGLEGEFVYGWCGADLLLIPTSSPDYIRITEFSEMLSKPESIKGKDLVLGGTYRTNKNEDWIYLGKFDEYTTNDWQSYTKDIGESLGWRYYFYNGSYQTMKSLTKRIVKTVSTSPVANYAELMEGLEHRSMYSPWDKSKDEYASYTIEEVKEKVEKGWGMSVFINYHGKLVSPNLRKHPEGYYYLQSSYWKSKDREIESTLVMESKDLKTLEELHGKFDFCKLNKYLKNGKLMKG